MSNTNSIHRHLYHLQLQQPQQRHAFTAGVVSVSLLWIVTSLWKRHYYYKSSHKNNENNDNDCDCINDGNIVFNKNSAYNNEGSNHDNNNIEHMYREIVKLAMNGKITAEAALKIMGNMTSRLSVVLPNKIKETRERWRWESLRHCSGGGGNYTGGAGINSGISLNKYKQDRDLLHLVQDDKDDDDEDDEKEDYFDDDNYDTIAELKNNTCIGSIFGFDVGGTLSKLLYFEEIPEGQIIHCNNSNTYNMAASSNISSKNWQSQSMSIRHSSKLLNNLKNDFDGNDHENTQHKSHPIKEQYHSTKNDFYNSHNKQLDIKQLPKYSKSADDTHNFELISKEKERQQALERFYAFVRDLDSSHGDNLKDKTKSIYSRTLGGQFHFIQFESRHFLQVMDLMKSSNIHLDITRIGATGGGAHKYAERWDKQLGIKIDKQDELESLVAGMQFILSDVIGECYTFSPQDKAHIDKLDSKLSERSEKSLTSQSSSVSATSTSTSTAVDGITKEQLPDDISAESSNNSQLPEELPKVTDHEAMKSRRIHGLDQYWWSRKVKRDFIIDKDSYPYILVMIGTGVSVLRVDGPRKHERISGSTIGGGSYWGLCRLLTDAQTFESALALAERGDPRKVDMMVGDIYGNNSDALEKLGLTADIVASSFGKLVTKKHPARGLTQEDLARALLLMVTNNIGQVAYLNAKLHNTKRIFFVGNFLRQNMLSQKRLSYAINFWSKGKMEALFLEHEGYFGALGAFLLHNNISQHQKKRTFTKESSPKDHLKPGCFGSKRSNSLYI